jgi:hypothetical protein
MSKLPQEKIDAADLPELSLTDASVSSADDDDTMPLPRPSEVATRINLLGKLIIPRSPH